MSQAWLPLSETCAYHVPGIGTFERGACWRVRLHVPGVGTCEGDAHGQLCLQCARRGERAKETPSWTKSGKTIWERVAGVGDCDTDLRA